MIIGDPNTQKTPALLSAMGRLVDSLGGQYIIADDVGITLADLSVVRGETRHTAAGTKAAQRTLAVAAYGVLMAIEATVEQVFGRADLAGMRFAILGPGTVGLPLCC